MKKKGDNNGNNAETHVAKVVRHGSAIVVPEDIPLDRTISILQQRMEEEEQVVNVSEVVDAFPWEGAMALNAALQQVFGYAPHSKTKRQGLFGAYFTPPEVRKVPSGPNGATVAVPWGRFTMPDDGYLDTEATKGQDGMVRFKVDGELKRKHQSALDKVLELTRATVKESSLYRGKAFRIRFHDNDGDRHNVPEITFLDIASMDLSAMSYNDDIMAAVESQVWTPIRHRQRLKDHGIPVKRGVLWGGPYGTGKTLLAYATAREALAHGWTFIYLSNVAELPMALGFARQYQPAVLFAEDVDRVTAGIRTSFLDAVLNTLDGVDSKESEVMLVLTTNNLSDIHRAMLRPGRLDTVLEVLPPNAATVMRLLRAYGGAMLQPGINVMPTAEALQGQIPAVIRETVERAKLVAITRDPAATDLQLTEADLAVATQTVLHQVALVSTDATIPPFDPAAAFMANGLTQVLGMVIHGDPGRRRAPTGPDVQ